MEPVYLRLSCAVQNYVWGKVGCGSEVALLKKGGDHVGSSQFTVDEKEHYAEVRNVFREETLMKWCMVSMAAICTPSPPQLWMGTHKKGPARIAYPQSSHGQLLSEWLQTNQWALGREVFAEFGSQLPFLLKVLSINKALSIQAHPTKSHAEQLHASSPDKYPDPNHKPELAIALSEFIGFCGFRPFNEIRRFVATIPELQRVVGRESCDTMTSLPDSGDTKAALRAVFMGLMGSDVNTIQEELGQLMSRLDDPNSNQGCIFC